MRSVQISVIIPLYDCEKYIGRCLRSLLKQTLNDSEYEIIVINDCSNDNSEDAIKPFIGDIRLFNNEKMIARIDNDIKIDFSNLELNNVIKFIDHLSDSMQSVNAPPIHLGLPMNSIIFL